MFHELDREEATAAARDLARALEAWAAGGPGHVETADAPQGPGVWLRVHAGPFSLLLSTLRRETQDVTEVRSHHANNAEAFFYGGS